jgi:hypothetical protein
MGSARRAGDGAVKCIGDTPQTFTTGHLDHPGLRCALTGLPAKRIRGGWQRRNSRQSFWAGWTVCENARVRSPLPKDSFRVYEREGKLLNADAGAGKEIAEAPGVIALSLNEKILAMTMAWVIKRGGEKLIPLGVGFETQGFRLQGAIETEGDLVGFAIELGNGHGGFKISFAAG